MQYYVYIMASKSGVIYVGVTNNLIKRAYEHKEGLIDGFTEKYKVKHLVYYEVSKDVNSAIAREKQIKNWSRAKKEKLINFMNSQWEDLWHKIA